MPTKDVPVNQKLIFVNVINDGSGLPIYRYTEFFSGDRADHIDVAPGDRVAWFVQVINGSNPTPAYQLVFSDPTLFGTATVSVPGGGNSGYQTVLAFGGTTKYTLYVNGFSIPSDPEIQVNRRGTQLIIDAAIPVFLIKWDPSAPDPVTYRRAGGSFNPMPAVLDIDAGSIVSWQLTTAEATTFAVVFTPSANHLQQTPLSVPYTTNAVPGNQKVDGTTESTGPLRVRDVCGEDPDFPFRLTRIDTGESSAVYAIRVTNSSCGLHPHSAK